jgi:hypothetical protein
MQYDEALNAYNTNAEIQENAEKSRTIEDPREATLRLLSTAIQSQEASNALRRANILSNRKQGRNAGFGWTIEELLQDHSEATNPLKSSAEKRRLKKQTKLHSQVSDLPPLSDLCHSSPSLLSLPYLPPLSTDSLSSRHEATFPFQNPKSH